MLQNMHKCAIIGCGFVGAATAFTLAKDGLFSEIVLLDVNQKKAEGEALDIAHGMPFGSPLKIYAGEYSDLADCGLIIIAAGANQKEGETRLDLVEKNAAIFRQIIPQIVKNNKDCILLILSNPVDILTHITLGLSGFPPERVIGSGTVLDTARFKYLLGEHFAVDMRNIHAFIIGEHGDSELAVWSSANVSGIDLDQYCRICGKCNGMEALRHLFDDVKNSAYSIIDAKGATYYAIAMSTARIVRAIVRDEHSVLTVSSLVEGHFGLSNVCMGLPSIVGRGGVEQILDIPLSDTEQKYLMESAQTLKSILEKVEKQNA